MNIVDLMSPHVAARPDAAAIIDAQHGRYRRMSFLELDELAWGFAGQLRSAGLKPGARILLVRRVDAELYALLLGIFRAEMVAVIAEAALCAAFQDTLARLAPDAVVTSAGLASAVLFMRGTRKIPRKFCLGEFFPGMTRLNLMKKPLKTEMKSAASSAIGSFAKVRAGECLATTQSDLSPPAAFATRLSSVTEARNVSELNYESIPDVPALITFTSGSTGVPKAICRTQRFLVRQISALSPCLERSEGRTVLVTLPLFVLENLTSGATSVLPDGSMSNPARLCPRKLSRQVTSLGVDRILASPVVLERMAKYCASHTFTLDRVSEVLTGGAPIFIPTLKAIERVFPRARIKTVYGSTEAEPIASISLDEISNEDIEAQRNGEGILSGLPVPGVSVKIIPDGLLDGISELSESTLQLLPTNNQQTGEILVSGNHVVTSYLDDPGLGVTKVGINGRIWHRTGDIGRMDPSGRIWLLGRASSTPFETGADSDAKPEPRGTEMSFQVEGCLAGVDGVRKSALVSFRGERVLLVEPSCRFIKKDLSYLSRQVTAVLESRLPPDRIVFVRKLPMDRRHNSKLDQRAARLILARLESQERLLAVSGNSYRYLRKYSSSIDCGTPTDAGLGLIQSVSPKMSSAGNLGLPKVPELAKSLSTGFTG